MTAVFQRAYPPALPADGPAIWLPFRGRELYVAQADAAWSLIRGATVGFEGFAPVAPLFLGTLNNVPCLACEIASDVPLPAGWNALGLRELWGGIDEPSYALAGYAAHLLLWQRTSRYCPVCGHPTVALAGDWGRACTACDYTRYPQISPAILALIHDGDRILLAQKPGWGTRYSIIAGFVEPGESLEGCVRREVAEEVGVELGAISYGGSQPWPFPDQLMIGYLAEYHSGEVVIDTTELADARWFSVDALPNLPPPLSLSRQLIDRWIASRRPS